MAENDPGGAFTFNQLKPLVAERIGPWKRTAVKIPLESSKSPTPTTIVSTYRQGKSSATLTLTDGGANRLANEAAQWKGPPNRRETDSGKEYVYREGGHTVREIEKRDASGREVMLMLSNGIVITASGEGVDMAALKALAEGIPLAKAEALVRPAN